MQIDGAIGISGLCQNQHSNRAGLWTMQPRLAFIVACCVLGACKTVDFAASAQATLGGQVEFYLSGGFAGIRQSLEIDDSGTIVVQDKKRGNIVRGQLESVRLADLRAAFMKIDVEPGSTSRQLGTRCADCYQYTINATVGGKHHHVAVNSAVLQTSPYGEIVQSLAQILHETLSSHRK